MTDVNATVTNITNIQRRSGDRVADLHATAKILGDASFATSATFDPLSHFGDFSYQLKVTGIQLTRANALAQAYAGLDFASGSGEFTMELEAKNNGMDSSSPTASRCQTEGANQTVNGEKESTHEA
jgi:hypothetical protein